MYACRPNDPDRKAERKIKATSEALKAVVEMPRGEIKKMKEATR